MKGSLYIFEIQARFENVAEYTGVKDNFESEFDLSEKDDYRAENNHADDRIVVSVGYSSESKADALYEDVKSRLESEDLSGFIHGDIKLISPEGSVLREDNY